MLIFTEFDSAGSTTSAPNNISWQARCKWAHSLRSVRRQQMHWVSKSWSQEALCPQPEWHHRRDEAVISP